MDDGFQVHVRGVVRVWVWVVCVSSPHLPFASIMSCSSSSLVLSMGLEKCFEKYAARSALMSLVSRNSRRYGPELKTGFEGNFGSHLTTPSLQTTSMRYCTGGCACRSLAATFSLARVIWGSAFDSFPDLVLLINCLADPMERRLESLLFLPRESSSSSPFEEVSMEEEVSAVAVEEDDALLPMVFFLLSLGDVSCCEKVEEEKTWLDEREEDKAEDGETMIGLLLPPIPCKSSC